MPSESIASTTTTDESASEGLDVSVRKDGSSGLSMDAKCRPGLTEKPSSMEIKYSS